MAAAAPGTARGALLAPSIAHPVLKEWARERVLRPESLIYPLFIAENDDACEPIGSLPGVTRWGVNRLEEALAQPVADGLCAVILFGVISDMPKDGRGSSADSDDSPVVRAIKTVAALYPQLLIVCDVCLCGYTDHGHCGILRDDLTLDNEASIARLAQVAVSYAAAGAHVVAPSDMMDGRIFAMKAALFSAGLSRVSVMSYAAKFCSKFYGPFRDAADSHMSFGDRSAYQLPPASAMLARRAVERDVKEGADFVMVKPGMPYLDIVRQTAEVADVPVAVYQVSGEYAMLYHAAAAGAFSLKDAVMESMDAFLRAGAQLIITYYSPAILKWMNGDDDVVVGAIGKKDCPVAPVDGGEADAAAAE